MKNYIKIGLISIGVLIVFILLLFILGVLNLSMFKFFAPRYENVRREVFENTQSYTHGKIQDLAKYKEEYDKAEFEEKELVRQIIILRFAEFDESKIKSQNLKNYLIKMRGY